jgi:hypothetical protein
MVGQDLAAGLGDEALAGQQVHLCKTVRCCSIGGQAGGCGAG